MDIDELAKEYDKQYKVLCAKVDGLKPLLSVYRGEDLFKLRRKMRIYYDMACECRKVSLHLCVYCNFSHCSFVFLILRIQ